jgi:hypothetical protein
MSSWLARTHILNDSPRAFLPLLARPRGLSGFTRWTTVGRPWAIPSGPGAVFCPTFGALRTTKMKPTSSMARDVRFRSGYGGEPSWSLAWLPAARDPRTEPPYGRRMQEIHGRRRDETAAELGRVAENCVAAGGAGDAARENSRCDRRCAACRRGRTARFGHADCCDPLRPASRCLASMSAAVVLGLGPGLEIGKLPALFGCG